MLPHSKEAVVKEVNETSVVLDVAGATITWSREGFDNPQVGDTMYLVPLSKEDMETERNEFAKALLNSVLNPDEVGP